MTSQVATPPIHTDLSLSLGRRDHQPDYTEGSGTLDEVVRQRLGTPRPPRPDEAGPSHWFQRNPSRPSTPEWEHEPPELQNISTLIHSRFRISPPLVADPLNPLLQISPRRAPVQLNQHEDELYSPTTPLDLGGLPFANTLADRSQELLSHTTQPSSAVRDQQALGLQVRLEFPGKRRRDWLHDRSQSVSSYLGPTTDVIMDRDARQKRRLDEWDSKGGFTISGRQNGPLFNAKALTDVSMARKLGVNADVTTFVASPKKRAATTSPLCSTAIWSLKRSRGSPEDLIAVQDDASSHLTHTPMETQGTEGGLENTQVHTAGSGDVTDPDQSPKDQ